MCILNASQPLFEMNFRQRHFGATSWPLYADASFTWASYPISADTFGVTVCACFHPQLWGEKLPSWESGLNWGSMSKLLFDQCKLCCSAVKVEFCWMNIISLVWVYKPHKLHEVNFSLLQHWQHGQWEAQATGHTFCEVHAPWQIMAPCRLENISGIGSSQCPTTSTAHSRHGFSVGRAWFSIRIPLVRHFQDWN